jgi:hypothetical protein
MPTVLVRTPRCPVCRHDDIMEVDEHGYTAWLNGTLIQDAFPEMTADDREMLKTGTHPECWEKMFGDDE